MPYVTDFDEEALPQYLTCIKTGSGSVVIEYHLDAAATLTATGTTGLVEEEADRLDKAFAKELTDSTAATLGIRNRGVISEADSHRGRLGLMREDGVICLIELCFISNKSDLQALFNNMQRLAAQHAQIIARYERLVA
jgi:N-acetylmuramoyl-L-alanine amidase